MKTTSISIGLLTVFVVGLSGCQSASRSRTTRDAAVGATAGAVIGGVIGHNSGDEAETGAAIGAVLGGAAGAAHGRARDRDDSRSFDDDDDYYRSLMTADEIDILRDRARASNRSNRKITDFLTAQERENLRRRDDALRRDELRDREIGR